MMCDRSETIFFCSHAYTLPHFGTNLGFAGQIELCSIYYCTVRVLTQRMRNAKAHQLEGFDSRSVVICRVGVTLRDPAVTSILDLGSDAR